MQRPGKSKAAEQPSLAAKKPRATGVHARTSAVAWIFRLWALFALLFALNVMHPFDPEVSTDPLPRVDSPPGSLVPRSDKAIVSEEWFVSAGVKCHAWLVLPKTSGTRKPGVVVMATGFGAQKDMGLFRYAEKFASELGLASFMIDYRSFGLSHGTPRQLIDTDRHVADIIASANHVVSDARVDETRLFLWGTSLAGGHVIAAAASLGERVTGVISQSPTLDGRANLIFNLKNRGVLSSVRVVAAALTDGARAALGLSPAYIAICQPNDKGKMSFMKLPPGEYASYLSKHPPMQDPPKAYLGGWQNRAPARAGLPIVGITKARPILRMKEVTAPVLFISPGFDSVVPDMSSKALAMAVNPRSTIYHAASDIGHFELYLEGFDPAVKAMVAFLATFL